MQNEFSEKHPRTNATSEPHKVNVNPKSIGVLERDHTTALLLSIFLGVFGIDQFYLGRTGKGILKLFTLGLFGILWIIDILMIATKSVRGIVWREDKGSGNWLKRHPIWSVIIALFFIGIIGAATSGNNQNTTSNNTSDSSKQPKSNAASLTVAKINQPARDGKFEFTVTSFNCGQTEITAPDNPDITSQANGQFCVMNLTVKNIGNVAQDYMPDNQYLYDGSNKQYSYANDASNTANPTSSYFGVDVTLNPGVSASGATVFDIPKGVTPTYVMLHDSAASNGVKVSLQ